MKMISSRKFCRVNYVDRTIGYRSRQSHIVRNELLMQLRTSGNLKKDCVGAIDGTHVRVKVSSGEAARYRGRKEHPTQIVLAACSFDLKFTYVLPGWEGTASDSRIIKNALNREDKLIIPNGKYYLVDAGFILKRGLLTPYRNVSQSEMKELSVSNGYDLRPDPDEALNWIAQMETKFKALRFPEDVKVQVVIPFLVGNAENLWTSMEPMIDVAENDITWEEFKEMFLDQYFPRALRKKRQNDFYSLRQTGYMTVLQYANKFTSLGHFCTKVFEDEEEKMDRFEQGMREEIGFQLASHKFTTFNNMYDVALAVEMRFKLNEGERSIGKKPRWMMGSNQAAGTRQQGNFQNANKRQGPVNANGGKLK
ncbi:hypothetical protein ACH5RR_023495 [Cinchona calisaya]|uniref:Uncharacterized protein n=1 Tax=Cinchona calisaya TaxID=153742 RepID=A0ABD2ZBZ3_9GENT